MFTNFSIFLFARRSSNTLPHRSRHPTVSLPRVGHEEGRALPAWTFSQCALPNVVGAPVESGSGNCSTEPPSSHGTFFPTLPLLLWVVGAFTGPREERPQALANEKLPRGCSARALCLCNPFSDVLCRDFGMSKERPSKPQAAKQRDPSDCLSGNMSLDEGRKTTC